MPQIWRPGTLLVVFTGADETPPHTLILRRVGGKEVVLGVYEPTRGRTLVDQIAELLYPGGTSVLQEE